MLRRGSDNIPNSASFVSEVEMAHDEVSAARYYLLRR